jgi:GT2 family glycosyltransferase
MTPIAVAVVSYNTCDVLRACLDSVVSDAADVELVVADNGSTDGRLEMVRREFPRARLLVDRSNPGYGAAANAAVAACEAAYVLLLNSDTVLRAGTIAALAAYLDAHPRVGIVGPRLLNPDGSLQRSCFPWIGTFRYFFEKSALARTAARIPPLRDRLFIRWSSHERARHVPWVLGAALAIRRSAFDQVGGFDPSFFMYGEEVDLAYRLSRTGWQIHFAPVADIVHVGGVSTARLPVAMSVQQTLSSLHFYRRHYSPRHVRALTFSLRTAARLRLVRARWGAAVGANSTVRNVRRAELQRQSEIVRLAWAAVGDQRTNTPGDAGA